ncbi:glycosyltransferase [Jannaschia sp. S6380]|uniref:glycosyltransferase n=1 Tax=Jannaschia sp. S6380 TaxID=2926408 RepID=UPI001FF4C49E|nr:glycosyltransferase [Jannaschia sp. S6380]MCK0168470.1 glycosyltransferase [Jannaschia sp. S6380]
MILRRFISRMGARTGAFDAPFRPAGRIYAVGDVHGRHDLLQLALRHIGQDDARHAVPATLVMLGDYVDRGDGAAEVLSLLRALPEWFRGDVVCLAGNHERMMLDFLADPPRNGPVWLANGGLQTLASFGVGLGDPGDGAALMAAADALRAAMPDGTADWLDDRPLHWRSGNAIFVHAGLDPAYPLEAQEDATLLWGHAAFDRTSRQDGHWVVHGHTIVPEPLAVEGRIALDTGAWATGRLTVGILGSGAPRYVTITADGAEDPRPMLLFPGPDRGYPVAATEGRETMAVVETIARERAVPPGVVEPAEVIVVVPTLNEASHIEACLTSLDRGDPFMVDVRVVVADGGSTDRTRAIVADLARARPGLTLVDNPPRLQSAGINAAVAAEAGPDHRYLVRCDAHAVYPPGYVRRVAEALAARPDAASVASVLDAEGDGCFQRASAWVVDTPLGSGGSGHRGGARSGWVDHGHHAGFRLDWFRRVGGYDPSFSHNEDAEYDHRLGLAGGRVWLDAGLRTGYRVRPTARGLARQYWNYGRGRARTVRKHRMRPRLRQLIPAANLLGMVLALVVAPAWPPALIWPIAYLLALAMVSGVAALRLRSPCGLLAGPALAIMHNAWGAGFLWQIARRG